MVRICSKKRLRARLAVRAAIQICSRQSQTVSIAKAHIALFVDIRYKVGVAKRTIAMEPSRFKTWLGEIRVANRATTATGLAGIGAV